LLLLHFIARVLRKSLYILVGLIKKLRIILYLNIFLIELLEL